MYLKNIHKDTQKKASRKPKDKVMETSGVDHDYFLCVNFKIAVIFFYLKYTNNEVKQCQFR